MKTKKILNTCAGLITVGGASAGGYYAFNSIKDEKAIPSEQKDDLSEKKSTGTKSTKSMRQILKDSGLHPLDTSTDKDNSSWQSLIEKFISGGLDESEKIVALIGRTSDPRQDGPTNMKNIRDACNKLFEKTEDKDTDFEKNKKLAESWCTAESNLLKGAGSLRRS
ncbi:hypothetical protein A6V39_00595 [Candidatus Mycoplasma haematobovis]|uniref:Lipoprotein n=1 Tax=Candidatus Mycoplasma haematobovis TaxID=432608 RepID=A0A1A9QFR1_9MOLU|nr:hypothetical protein [Candidatus Mycoplasma haematobovis]OAL10549.1 hypothetical protein A6V39_00595 [Candidatus Mycoplasma haematobovis]